jgi:Cu+-exporting ATPase
MTLQRGLPKSLFRCVTFSYPHLAHFSHNERQEISDIGFEATVIPKTRLDSVTLRIYGMTCASCTSSIESALLSLPGVNSVSISLSLGTCVVSFDSTLTGPREMVERIGDTGFDAILSDALENATQIQSLTRAKEINEWKTRLIWSSTFALPVFFISMIAPKISLLKPIVDFKLMRGIYLGDVVVLALTTPCQFWVGRKFYRSAYKSLRHGMATMDVLVTLGTSAAYFYSLFAMFFATFNPAPDFHPFVFFDTSTMLITFVSLGRYLENNAKGRTSAAITDLMALAPSMTTIYTDAPACTAEKRVPTELVQVGDIVKLVPGDKVPADGVVIKGNSSIDESAVTGEPMPVLKQAGDSVIGGTVNGLGTLDMRVTRAGRDTALAQIVRLVEEAQTSKAPIQTFADRAAGYFVPTVLSIAFFTFTVWIVLSNFVDDQSLPMMFHRHGASKFAVCLQICISVIVVACPCALGLSTPTAIMVGTGVGAKNGILIKGGRALEASSSIRRIVLDKTGTVTIGKMSVASSAWADSSAGGAESGATLYQTCADGKTSKTTVLAMVGAIEARSEHPLAKAIVLYTKEKLTSLPCDAVETEGFESVAGSGVKAQCSLKEKGRHTLLIGTRRFTLGDDAAYLPAALEDFEVQEMALGRTVIFVSILSHSESIPVLAISLSDAPKPSSAQAVAALKEMGIEVNMMTGDGRATALAVAEQVGIPPECVWASMSPKGKAATITEMLKEGNGGVAMVKLVKFPSTFRPADFFSD